MEWQQGAKLNSGFGYTQFDSTGPYYNLHLGTKNKLVSSQSDFQRWWGEKCCISL